METKTLSVGICAHILIYMLNEIHSCILIAENAVWLLIAGLQVMS